MTSDPSDTDLLKLVSDTEANFKRIERYNEDFVSVSLNEWRYATRHIVELMCQMDVQSNRAQAIFHLQRAYFDSCDILIDCILSRFEELHREYRNYASLVKTYISDYAGKIGLMREAKELHRLAGESRDRTEFYGRMADICDRAELFVKEIEDTADDWRSDIRAKARSERIVLVGVAAAVLTLVPLAISLFGKIIALFR